jgi:hypothetical protein
MSLFFALVWALHFAKRSSVAGTTAFGKEAHIAGFQ